MIGVFDSGDGGLTALREIRRISPTADIIYSADRKNAPYGTKTKNELIRLVSADIEGLCKLGAERILMACCTASTVYGLLPKELQSIALPIIPPAVREAAAQTENGRIGVIATEYTVSSHAFGSSLSDHSSVKEVFEEPAQWLVSAVENGARDGNVKKETVTELRRLLDPFKEKCIDTLILGCTHFSHLEEEIGRLLPNVRIISPSREGAKEITKGIPHKGCGRTLYIQT